MHKHKVADDIVEPIEQRIHDGRSSAVVVVGADDGERLHTSDGSAMPNKHSHSCIQNSRPCECMPGLVVSPRNPVDGKAFHCARVRIQPSA